MCNRVCLCQNIWCMRHDVCFQELNFFVCKQTQLFRYPVNSTIIFFKSFWTRFVKLNFFDKFYFPHNAQGVPAYSLKCCSPYEMYPSPRKGICRSLPKFRCYFIYLFNFFQSLYFTWDMDGWIALWYEMHILERCRLRQTKTQQNW